MIDDATDASEKENNTFHWRFVMGGKPTN